MFKYILKNSFFSIAAACGAHASQSDDCRSRVTNAIDNAGALGGNDSDKFRWAQYAANECIKELASEKSNSGDPGFGSFLIIFLILLGLGFCFLMLREELNRHKPKASTQFKKNEAEQFQRNLELVKQQKDHLNDRVLKLQQEIEECSKAEIIISEEIRKTKEVCESLIGGIHAVDLALREKMIGNYNYEMVQATEDLQCELVLISTKKDRILNNVNYLKSAKYTDETTSARNSRRIQEIKEYQQKEVYAITKKWIGKIDAIDLLTAKQRGSKRRSLLKKREDELVATNQMHDRILTAAIKIYGALEIPHNG